MEGSRSGEVSHIMSYAFTPHICILTIPPHLHTSTPPHLHISTPPQVRDYINSLEAHLVEAQRQAGRLAKKVRWRRTRRGGRGRWRCLLKMWIQLVGLLPDCTSRIYQEAELAGALAEFGNAAEGLVGGESVEGS